MSEIRPQYHFRQTGVGLDAWFVERLVTLSKNLPLQHIDPTKIAELRENHWYFHDGSVPTPLSIIEHARLINEADLSFPVILDSAGRVMDGMHRICKAVLIGRSTVAALQFEEDPQPDFVNCDPDDLPYDA
jgi:hypothetical protein